MKYDINRLIHALHGLYLKISAFNLLKRINCYRNNTCSTLNSDISNPLEKHINKLAEESKQGIASSNITIRSSTEVESQETKKNKKPLTRLKKILGGLTRYFKMSARKIESNQYMSDRLKASTWDHIHTALMQARNGGVTTARLHADIANQALKEAGHYMSEENYKEFFNEVKAELNKLDNIK